ncbi:type II secretion system F family protein [Actinotalea ferrariae]|uniref:type II secretion system F family protein n=1 Tax=Actinotalea ferrariae TaxID=1386098 RepID=UPI001C8B93D7|nr:type II secretion system F family protein [Actinotalea ferrariae]MBX9243808.1 type II secretion system F family protein [Actinotalea ferrariae]
MRTLLGGLAGAATIAGLMLAVAGWRGTPDMLPALPGRSRRVIGTPRTGWARWRWPVALSAGAIVWALSPWPVAAALTVTTVVGLPILLATSSAAQARITRVEAIEEWTRRLSDVLTTGAGLEQAITTTARSCPAPLRTEVGALVARLAARWPTDRALRAFATDLHDPAGDLVVAALMLAAHRRGPGLASVLAGVAGSVGEDVAARRRIEAERARPRTTAKAVTVITLGMVAVGAVNGSYLTPYGEPLGQVVLAVIAAAFIGCLLWMRRLTLPAADSRFLAPDTDAR